MTPSSLVLESRQVGDVRISALWDADWSFVPTQLVPRVSAGDWTRYTGLPAGAPVPSRVLAFLLHDDPRTLVVDLGVGEGNGWPMPGRLPEALAQAGQDTADVDVVIVSHLHSDHVGGGTGIHDGRRVPSFPTARHLVPRADWDRFTSREYLERTENATSRAVEHAALVLDDLGLVDLVDGGHAVTAAIDLLPTPGHTPGSLTVRVRSRGEEALIIGDAAHHEAQLAEPEWSSTSDLDPAAAAASRRWIAAEAIETQALVAGSHFQAGGPVFAPLTPIGDRRVWNAGAHR